jgi:type IV secretory pathway ATPase VirB11/archaellum biosynthesis ATPase
MEMRDKIIDMVYRKGFKKDVLTRNPHLLEYILRISGSYGMPEFLETLGDELRYADRFNVIYPVGDPIFIHACTLEKGGSSNYSRKYYVVEPEVPSRELIEAVEEAFAITSGEYEAPEDLDEKRELILKILEKILIPVNRERGYFRQRGKRVEVSREDLNSIKYYMLREKIGTSVLEPFLRDPYIEDISCPGAGCIYLVHKIFGPMEANICFKDNDELNRFIIRISERIGKPVSRARPIVDAVLPDGSRVNIVYGEDVSLKGSNFTIRKFSKEPISVVQLIRWGTMSPEVAAYLWMALREQMNVWICGETASGKTTTLNAIAAFIPPEYKIISIEDTAEVNLPHENWVRELTRDTGSPESSITMFDLLRAALRQRPNYIIVGEIRGREGNIAFQAMQSVPWYTPIAVRRGHDVEIAAIGYIVDSYFKDDEKDGEKIVSDLEVLTITRNMGVDFKRVSKVIRHWYRGKLYRLRLSDGSYVDVTGSHSVIAYNPVRGLYEAKPTELYEGDWLLTASLPIASFSTSVELGQESPEILGYLCGMALASGELIEDGNNSLLKISISGGREVPILLKVLTHLRGYVEVFYFRGGIGIKAPRDSKIACAMRCANGVFPYEAILARSCIYGIIRAIEEICGSRCWEKTFKGIKLSNMIDWLKRIHRLEDLEDPISNNGEGGALDGLEIGRGIKILSVVSIEEIDYKGYVYDLSVPGEETFLGGSRPILLHNTGHGVMSTFHAANIQRLIQRLTGSPIEVPPSYLDNLNIAVFQSAVYDKRGRLMRRVIEVDEIIGYDPERGRIAYLPSFTWDPGRDVHIYMGRGSSFILEYKIALRRGIARSQIKSIYDELGMRARFLELLARNRVTSYWKVWRAIRATYLHPLEELVGRLEKGDVSFIEEVGETRGSGGKTQA